MILGRSMSIVSNRSLFSIVELAQFTNSPTVQRFVFDIRRNVHLEFETRSNGRRRDGKVNATNGRTEGSRCLQVATKTTSWKTNEIQLPFFIKPPTAAGEHATEQRSSFGDISKRYGSNLTSTTDGVDASRPNECLPLDFNILRLIYCQL